MQHDVASQGKTSSVNEFCPPGRRFENGANPKRENARETGGKGSRSRRARTMASRPSLTQSRRGVRNFAQPWWKNRVFWIFSG